MILYHFTHWPRAMGTTKVGPGKLAIDCLRPSPWSELDDTCVWLTANPDPTPEDQPISACVFVRIEVRLPRTWRLRKPSLGVTDWDLMTDRYGTGFTKRLVKATKRDWWKSYDPIPHEYFTGGLAVTGEPFWCCPIEAAMREAA